MTDHLIHPKALHDWVSALARTAGSNADEARLTAEMLVGANLAGHDSHGVGMVPRYVKSWRANELQLNQQLLELGRSGSVLRVDGQRGMGSVMAHEGMRRAIAIARDDGVCVLGLRHAHHIGRIGQWAEQAVAAGMVSVHFVNAVSDPVVAPHGGRQARYVTNPFAVGIPVPGGEPMVLDFATSAIAMGKVRVAHNKGVEVPAGALIDATGRPTQDPGVMYPPQGGEAGALLPFAAHKGYALAMVCEVLGAALTGGETTRPAFMTMQHGVWNNMLAIVFDPQRLNGTVAFGAEVKAFVDWVRSAALAPDAAAIQMPGDPERAARRARAEAIAIDTETLAELDQAAAIVAEASGKAVEPLSLRTRAA
jgi:hydroxycarboxylate dehydrogenase B